MIIAIDGPSGSGKSTLAKTIAKRINYDYLDTGAMYRLITFYFLKNNIQLTSNVDISWLKKNINIEINKNEFYLNGKIIKNEIRTPEVTKNIAPFANNKIIRDYLIQLQREVAKNKNIIIDGRDIASVVFPNSEVKIYLDASPEIRAKRRVRQNKDLNIETNYEEILESIKIRDYKDMNRDIGPLVRVEEAYYINSSELSLKETEEKLIKVIRKRINEI